MTEKEYETLKVGNTILFMPTYYGNHSQHGWEIVEIDKYGKCVHMKTEHGEKYWVRKDGMLKDVYQVGHKSCTSYNIDETELE